MKRITTYGFIGIELIGCWLLSQHRYMNFRLDVFIVMALVAVVFLACETLYYIFKKQYEADIIDTLFSFEFTEKDLEEIEEIKKEIIEKVK